MGHTLLLSMISTMVANLPWDGPLLIKTTRPTSTNLQLEALTTVSVDIFDVCYESKSLQMYRQVPLSVYIGPNLMAGIIILMFVEISSDSRQAREAFTSANPFAGIGLKAWRVSIAKSMSADIRTSQTRTLTHFFGPISRARSFFTQLRPTRHKN